MATYTDSCRHPEGFSYVWVNGTAALANGVETGFLSGRVLRKGQ
jgi:N-acyl-D-aspartate/D-glutamate deacylase